jgi:hypothetical protein
MFIVLFYFYLSMFCIAVEHLIKYILIGFLKNKIG